MDYTNLPDNVLRLILKEMVIRQENEDCDFDYEPFNSECESELISICGYFGIELKNFTDRSFFIQLWNENPNFETESIFRPTLGKYDVIESEDVREYKTNYFRQQIESYYPVDSDMIYQLNENDEHHYWDGSFFDSDVHDSEVTSSEIYRIDKID